MQEKKLEIYLFFILLAVALFLSFKVLEPYIYVLIVASIFAVIFSPIHQFFRKKLLRHESLSALFTVFSVIVLVLVPFVFFGVQLSDEVKALYDNSLNALNGDGIVGRVTETANRVLVAFSPIEINKPVFDTADTESYIISTLSWLKGNFGGIFSGLAKFFVNVFLFLIAFYFLVRDGEKLKQYIVEISPFKDERDELILNKLHLAIMSIAKGSILVAIIQGILCIVGFSIFGVPSPVLWGGVAMVAALIPGLGTSLVLMPAILFLFFMGDTTHAIGLLIWGMLAVGLVDNLLGPKLVGSGIKIHPLLILLSALGGISFFGALGFILGPITISFLFAVIDIYKTILVKDVR